MVNEKQNLINVYAELGAVLQKTSVAIAEFNKVLAVTADPKEQAILMANAPMNLPYFAAVAPANGAADEANGKKSKKEKKEKKIKDPLAPKRPPSAYLEFQNSVRTQFRDEAPDTPYQDILRKISAVWNGMPEDEKKLYQDITNGKVVQYEQAKHAYELQHGLPVTAPKGGDSDMTDITVAGTPKTLGKDGKEYTGKKRGRKSNADKLKEAEEAAGLDADNPADVVAIAKLAADAAAAQKKAKKDKADLKKANAAPIVPASATKPKTPKSNGKAIVLPPVESSEDDSDSGEEDSSDEDSDDDDDDDEEEEAAPVASTSKAAKKADVPSKSKKSKTA